MEGLSRREIPENRISRQSKSAHTKRRVRSAVGFCLMMGKARRKEKSLSNKKNTAIPVRTAVCTKYGFCLVLGGKPPGFFLSGSMLSPYGDKLTSTTTFPQIEMLIEVV